MVFKRIKRKARALRGRVFAKLGYAPVDVSVSGLKAGEQVFKESIAEECRAALKKIRKRVSASSIKIRVKSFKRGKGSRFEVAASVRLSRGELHTSASDRELYPALMRVLYELEQAAARSKR